MIKQIITFIMNLFLKVHDKQDRNLEDQNWYNPKGVIQSKLAKGKQPSKPKEELSKQEYKDIQFSSPTEMDIPYVTSPYGWRLIFGKRNFHTGTDFRAYEGTSARAIEDSIVVHIVEVGKYKNRFKNIKGKLTLFYSAQQSPTPKIILQGLHTGNKYTYAHCKKKGGLKVGVKLKCGQRLGGFGNYGYSNGSHAHIEVHIWRPLKKTFQRVNPRAWFKKRVGMKFTGRTRSVTVKAFDDLDVGK